MGKYLDSIDYNKIVFNTFQLPESDFYKYYSNKVEDHFADNPDLFDELEAAVERRIKWYRDRHPDDYSIDEWMIDNDGKNVLDKNGKKIKVTRILDFEEADQVCIPLLVHLPGYGLGRSINKSFFDQQIAVIHSLSIVNTLRNFIDKQTVKGGKKKRTKTFQDLFIRKEIGDQVIKILIDNGYLTNGKWNYPKGIDKSIATPFYVLQEYFGLIKQHGSLGTKLRIWCAGLGVPAEVNFIRNLKLNPADGKRPTQSFKNERKEFFKIFEYRFKVLNPLPEDYPNTK